MMLCVSLHDAPYPEQDPGHLTVSRIEIFVIPALAIDGTGYRVCLRLTTELGYGWSEQFVCESDADFDLDTWSRQLRIFVGRFPLSSLTERLTERIAGISEPDNRPFALFTNAVNAVRQRYTVPNAESVAPPRQIEESVLRLRAVAYVSLD